MVFTHRRSPAKKRAAASALVLIVGGVSVGCAYLRGDGTDDDGPATSVSAPERKDLEEFYAQTLTWEPCVFPDMTGVAEGLECTTVKVPLDYRKPDGKKIDLALDRLKATDPERRVGSLLTNPGGPGGSGIALVAGGDEVFTEALRAGYDIVGFDPRGVGASTPLRCLTVSEIQELESLDSPPEDSGEQEQARNEMGLIIDGCKRRSGDLLPHLGTENVARDLDILRAVLGDDKLHYLGFSYGTVLGQSYAEQFPDTVGRMVLDSVADPKVWPSYDAQIEQFTAIQRELDEFIAWCASGPDCPLGTSPEQARQTLTTAMDHIEEEPLTAPDTPDEPVTDTELRLAINDGLYSPALWPVIRALLQGAVAGDGTAVRNILKLSSDGDEPQDPEDDLGQKVMFGAVMCLVSDGRDITPQRTQQFLDKAVDVSPFFGPFVTLGIDCSKWPAEPTVKAHPVTATGSPPILVVSNTRDNVTPIQWARAVARQLDNATLVENDGDGHGVYGKGPCVNTPVDAYLLDGALPEPGTTCADTGIPPHQPRLAPA